MESKRMMSVVCIIALFVSAIIALDHSALIRQTQAGTTENLLLIDPGHGGMDGGAVSSNGVSEKNINLAIGLQLREMAGEYGWQVVMTRQDDRWLCDSEEGSIRSRKTEDLKARCQMIADYAPQVAVSIHLNSFVEDPSVKGIQVFYPDREDGKSKVFAEIMQKELNEALQVEKERTAMTRDGVLIFRDAVCPIVIVECGFLSNPEDTQMLRTGEYQQQIAAGILNGINSFTGAKSPESVEIIDSLR